MSERNQSDSPNVPDEVWQKIREIAEKSVPDGYIYRGEAECHPKVCSGLYRPYLGSEIENPDIMGSQNIILEKVRTYLPEISDLGDDEILTQLQHYGCKTNLIDFTTDYLIALFFACGESEGGTGRVILLPRKPQCTDNYRVVPPLRTISRIESQKSILVESKTGFVQPACIVFIRRELKRPMLDYLERCHDISEERIYNDIHGFIKWREILPHALERFKGNYDIAAKLEHSCHNYNLRAQSQFQEGHYSSAAATYTEVIKLSPEDPMAYRNRALALANSEDFNLDDVFKSVIEDYNKAIELNPNEPLFYFERALIWCRREEWDETRADLEAARNRGANLKAAENQGTKLKDLFNQKIRDFEKQYDVVLPADIAEMLTS